MHRVPAPPETCWLHPGIEVRESPMEGRGLFATEPINAGGVVARLGGRLVSEIELRDLFASSSSYVDTITVLPDVHLVLPGRQPIGFGNHSCDPALWHADAFTLDGTPRHRHRRRGHGRLRHPDS